MDTEYLSDEEIIYLKWLREENNSLTAEEIKNYEKIIKYSFFQGFSAGFNYKARIKAEEMLQK